MITSASALVEGLRAANAEIRFLFSKRNHPSQSSLFFSNHFFLDAKRNLNLSGARQVRFFLLSSSEMGCQEDALFSFDGRTNASESASIGPLRPLAISQNSRKRRNRRA